MPTNSKVQKKDLGLRGFVEYMTEFRQLELTGGSIASEQQEEIIIEEPGGLPGEGEGQEEGEIIIPEEPIGPQ